MAASTFTHDQVLAAFEARFDYLSARALLDEALTKSGVAKSGAYDGAALAKLAGEIEKLPRAQVILSRLAAPSPAAAPAPAAPAPKAEPKAEAKPEPKAEAAPAAEAAAADAPAADAGHEDGGDKPAEKKAKKKEG